MELTMIREMYESHNFSIEESFDNWEDAVRASVKPFINNGIVKPEYADRVVEMVHEYGPYICIAPHIAIPHAMAPELVLSEEAHICFMKVNNPVIFGEGDIERSELFFALCAPSGQAHMQELMVLAEALEDEELIDALLNAKTDADFRELLSITD